MQALGVTEAGTFRFLLIMLRPLPNGPVGCPKVGDVADSEPVFPVDVFPAEVFPVDDDSGRSMSMAHFWSDNCEI